MTVTATDDDTAGFTLSPSPLAITEGDAEVTGTYTVVLNSEPTAGVVVTVSKASGGSDDVTITDDDGDATNGLATALTFSTGNWSDEQTVTVTVAHDADGATEPTTTLSHSGSGGGYGSVTASQTVNVTEDEVYGISFSPSVLKINEANADVEGEYEVVLDVVPTGDVTVTVSKKAGGSDDVSFDTDAAAGDQSTLTFTTGNWSTAQTVTVTLAPDVDTATETTWLTHSASGGGYGSVSEDYKVKAVDDEDSTAPGVSSVARHNPSSSPTNADSVTWRVTFDEDVENVTADDFSVSGPTGATCRCRATTTSGT